jgi:hypothetical protein
LSFPVISRIGLAGASVTLADSPPGNLPCLILGVKVAHYPTVDGAPSEQGSVP